MNIDLEISFRDSNGDKKTFQTGKLKITKDFWDHCKYGLVHRRPITYNLPLLLWKCTIP